jgi:hypothetical protein
MNHSKNNLLNSSKLINIIEYDNGQEIDTQLELQKKLLIKLKQLEESSILIESLKSMNNKISKCNTNNNIVSSTNTGRYGYAYLPGFIFLFFICYNYCVLFNFFFEIFNSVYSFVKSINFCYYTS